MGEAGVGRKGMEISSRKNYWRTIKDTATRPRVQHIEKSISKQHVGLDLGRIRPKNTD